MLARPSSRNKSPQKNDETPRPRNGSSLARWTGRRLRRFQQNNKSLVDVLTHENVTGIPDRRNDVRVSLVAVGFATAGLAVQPLAYATIPLLLYSGRNIIISGLKHLVQGKPTTATLVSLVILMGLGAQVYLFAAIASVVAVYSYVVSDRVKRSARSSMIDIFSQRPKTVWIPSDVGTEIEVPIEQIQQGDTVIVHTGEVIPIDGTVLTGLASVDQHILTGEAQPADKEEGDQVYASTVVMSGRLLVRVDKTGDETTVAQIGNILNQTLDFKAERQLKAEAWANASVVPTLIFTGAVIPFLGFQGGLAVIYAHYKRRMSMSAPVSILNYFRILSDQGILVKDGRTLDSIVDVDTVVFDKTGTLTIAQPTVGAVLTYADVDEDTVLSLAATAEDKQSHPIALAIREEASERQLKLARPQEAAYQVGYGLTVTVNGAKIRVGSLRFMKNEALAIPDALHEQQEESHQAGHSLVVVARDEKIIGALELVPTLRPEAQDVVGWLKDNGIQETYIISGDHDRPTAQLAAHLGIDHYFAEVLPQDKAEIIERLQSQGRTVCYIGDGINDSIALKRAAVSVSLNGASAIAVDTAQILLMQEDLRGLQTLFAYGREYDQNLRNMFRYTAAGPMIVTLATLPFPAITLSVALAMSIYSLSASLGYAMLPLWRYRYLQHRRAQKALKEPTNQLSKTSID